MLTLTVATVQVGNYEKRGQEYLAKLYDGVRRNMPRDVTLACVCITDDATLLPPGVRAKAPPFGLTGWWNKLVLFKPGMFEGRVLYLDLDMIVRGDLTDFANYAGNFAILRDPFFPEKMNSSLMAWEAGTMDHIWERFSDAGMPQFDHRGGDQNFIQAMQPEADRWQDICPGQIVSFKADCWKQGKAPTNARVIVFHGHPRPHECRARFIQELWNRPVDEDEAA